ncbi:peroxisomal membrane protein 11C [Polypterus senegalus]|uniref:peroxisomal membrane protein 11C n=1 Tax=Polypterus senegalus TaxID=55291 RepID=UPI001965B78C|nr:peroxisomal membrane protein 11C [Polypterus senegalus]
MAGHAERLVAVLESYRGRDKVIRTLCYGCQLVGGSMLQKSSGRSEVGRRLLLLSAQLSHCRTVLRLFDDLAMFLYTRDYGLGTEGEAAPLRCLSVIGNLVDQLYYPCEHIAWAADAKLIATRSERWWVASTALWGASLLVTVLRSTSVIVHLIQKRKKQEGRLEKSRMPSLERLVQEEILNVLSSAADLANAIHWMPPGFLWGGQFPDWLVGLLGTFSSLIGLHQMCNKGSGGNV